MSVVLALAIVTFRLSAQGGLVATSAVLASLTPGATILLAVALLGERIRAAQTVGLVLCGGTVALVALG